MIKYADTLHLGAMDSAVVGYCVYRAYADTLHLGAMDSPIGICAWCTDACGYHPPDALYENRTNG